MPTIAGVRRVDAAAAGAGGFGAQAGGAAAMAVAGAGVYPPRQTPDDQSEEQQVGKPAEAHRRHPHKGLFKYTPRVRDRQL